MVEMHIKLSFECKCGEELGSWKFSPMADKVICKCGKIYDIDAYVVEVDADGEAIDDDDES